MIPTHTKWMERFLQQRRFNMILPHVIGKRVLDFGGNKGELKEFLPGKDYTVCNYDYKEAIKDKTFDTIVMLAVIEHIEYKKVFSLIKELRKHLAPCGRIIITTPTKYSIPILELMSIIGITDRDNILEHKHYWTKNELYCLSLPYPKEIVTYKSFQFGMNQLFIMH